MGGKVRRRHGTCNNSRRGGEMHAFKNKHGGCRFILFTVTVAAVEHLRNEPLPVITRVRMHAQASSTTLCVLTYLGYAA